MWAGLAAPQLSSFCFAGALSSPPDLVKLCSNPAPAHVLASWSAGTSGPGPEGHSIPSLLPACMTLAPAGEPAGLCTAAWQCRCLRTQPPGWRRRLRPTFAAAASRRRPPPGPRPWASASAATAACAGRGSWCLGWQLKSIATPRRRQRWRRGGGWCPAGEMRLTWQTGTTPGEQGSPHEFSNLGSVYIAEGGEAAATGSQVSGRPVQLSQWPSLWG